MLFLVEKNHSLGLPPPPIHRHCVTKIDFQISNNLFRQPDLKGEKNPPTQAVK